MKGRIYCRACGYPEDVEVPMGQCCTFVKCDQCGTQQWGRPA